MQVCCALPFLARYLFADSRGTAAAGIFAAIGNTAVASHRAPVITRCGALGLHFTIAVGAAAAGVLAAIRYRACLGEGAPLIAGRGAHWLGSTITIGASAARVLAAIGNLAGSSERAPVVASRRAEVSKVLDDRQLALTNLSADVAFSKVIDTILVTYAQQLGTGLTAVFRSARCKTQNEHESGGEELPTSEVHDRHPAGLALIGQRIWPQNSTYYMSSSLEKVKNRDRLWKQATQEFVRAVRGKRSQLAFSRRLGYRGKPVADWERGRRFPTAVSLLSACQTIGIDVVGALERFHAESSAQAKGLDAMALARWLDRMRGTTPIIALARRSGQPRFSVSRWLSGQSQPRFPQFLALLDAITGRAPDLIAELVDISLVPTLREEYLRLQAHRQVAFEEPWTAAVQRVIETVAYAELPVHVTGWIAEYLGISVELERRCIARLQEAALVAWDGDKYRSDPTTVDTRRTAKENQAIKAHWNRVAATRLVQEHDEDVFAYNVISASREDCDRIEMILRSAYREIAGLVAASEPQEEVALIQVQMMRWRDPA